MNKKILFFILFIAPMFFYAQEISLTLDDALELGCSNSEDLRSMEIRLKAAERKANNSWNPIIPALNLSASDTVHFPSEESVNSFFLEGSADIAIKSDYFNLISKSKTDFEIEKINYLRALYDVRKAVSDFYFELSELKDEIEIKTEASENLNAVCAENKAKYQKGFLSETDYLASKILLEKSKAELSALKLDFERRSQSFKQIVGLAPEAEIATRSEPAEILKAFAESYENSKTEIEAAMRSENFLEVRLLECQKISAEQNLRAKKAELFGPEFGVSYNGGPVFSYPKADGRLQFNNSLTARISVRLDNLIGWSQGREELRECKDEIATFSILLENKKQTSLLELKNLMRQLEAQNAALRTYSQLLEITRRNLTLCQNNYSKGLLDFQSLKNASSEYLEAQIDYSGRITEMLKIYSEIERITAKKIR